MAIQAIFDKCSNIRKGSSQKNIQVLFFSPNSFSNFRDVATETHLNLFNFKFLYIGFHVVRIPKIDDLQLFDQIRLFEHDQIYNDFSNISESILKLSH